MKTMLEMAKAASVVLNESGLTGHDFAHDEEFAMFVYDARDWAFVSVSEDDNGPVAAIAWDDDMEPHKKWIPEVVLCR